MKIDIARCLHAMRKIEVAGLPEPGGRNALIEEAIVQIQTDPVKALSKEYLGIKNYAHFGDQREDHPYGYGPRHGTIVFSIGRNYSSRREEGPLDADCIYFLECFRDFGAWESHETNSYGRKQQMNLAQVLKKYQKLTEELEAYGNALESANVEPVSAGQPMLPKGRKKKPNEFDHASGCPADKQPVQQPPVEDEKER